MFLLKLVDCYRFKKEHISQSQIVKEGALNLSGHLTICCKCKLVLEEYSKGYILEYSKIVPL
jgi:hypothetical protein